MSVQSQFNKHAIDLMPKVRTAINFTLSQGKDFEANQMICFSLQEINNFITPLSEMNEEEIESASNALLRNFKEKGWL